MAVEVLKLASVFRTFVKSVIQKKTLPKHLKRSFNETYILRERLPYKCENDQILWVDIVCWNKAI